jgi:hypothetical protein
MKAVGFNLNNDIPEVHCTFYEDNIGALEMARLPKMRPRTKHLNVKYHHFREAVANKLITFHYIQSRLQLADILTKAVIIALFIDLRMRAMGW